MIDTQEKLEAVFKEHRIAILGEALKDFAKCRDSDVWGTYWIDEEDQVDYNVYQSDDSDNLTVWVYALKHTPEDPTYIMTVNTEIGLFVAHVDLMDE
jgi:hypothetical protein